MARVLGRRRGSWGAGDGEGVKAEEGMKKLKEEEVDTEQERKEGGERDGGGE